MMNSSCGKSTENEDYEESSKCNAATHFSFFTDKLKFHGLRFKTWCKYLIGDNNNLNPNIAKLVDQPFVGLIRSAFS